MSRGYGRTQRAILDHLQHNDWIGVAALAEACGVDPRNLARTLARLETDGAVDTRRRFEWKPYRWQRPPGVAGDFTEARRGHIVLQVRLSDAPSTSAVTYEESP